MCSNNHEYQLKIASMDDARAVYALFSELIDELNRTRNYPCWDKETYQTMDYFLDKARKGELFQFLDFGGNLCGAVVLNEEQADGYEKVPFKGEEPFWVVHCFGIRKDLRGLGLGNSALEAMTNQAKRRGIRSIRLDTFHSNTPAVHFYRKAGFKDLGAYELHYEGVDNRDFELFEKILL